MHTHRENILIILILFTACVVTYLASVNFGFIWDDEYLVVNNALIRAPLWSFQPFKQDIINSNFVYTIYYRPLQILSYAVDYRIWGLSPFGFHLSNILFHFLNGLLVFALTFKLTDKKDIAVLTAIFFLVYPLHAGAVSYVSGRADLVSFFFGFLFFIFFLLFKEKGKIGLFAGSVIFLLAAVLSKEIALIFPVLLLLADYIMLKGKYRFRIIHHVPNFILAASYIFLHHALFSGRYSPLLKGGFLKKALDYFTMTGEFFLLSFAPVNLYMRREIHMTSFELAGLMILLGIIFFLMFRFKDIRRISFFGIMFFAAALIPLVFVMDHFGVFAEHWMYVASYGVFLLISAVLIRLFRQKNVFQKVLAVALILFLIFFHASGTVGQVAHWRDDVALSDLILASSGKDSAAVFYKAASFMRNRSPLRSIELMDEYVGQSPSDLRTLYIRGRLNLAAGNTEKAVKDFKRAIEINPLYDNGHLGMAYASFIYGDDEKGISYLERVIEINPKHREALLVLSTAYSSAGENEKALEAAEKAKKMNPYDYNAIVNLGTAYSRMGGLQEAATLYLKAIDLYPERPVPYYNLGYVFYLGGEKEEAEIYLRKALEIDPNFRQAIELLNKLK